VVEEVFPEKVRNPVHDDPVAATFVTRSIPAAS
jgi:hypothetical protein